MKRKRGHKKKKGKPKAETNTVIVNVEDNEILDERGSTDIDENKAESAMEVDTPPLSTDQQQQNVANVNADGLIKKGTGKSVGRVKVKLKTPKTVESQLTSSEACTQSDTDKSSQQRQGLVSEKMEDSANSLSKMGKKAGSIKIKSSNTLGSDPVLACSESPQEKESSKIIKKVMKMDAAEPFNVRVDPEALGIPDYFDVIDTPMDFGTICSNLELGVKYRNSEDVFKDVQYIWDNCYKYNNKGDYILDLMRRVKKNFSKYWASAGLYSGHSTRISGVESSQENISPSDEVKVHIKGGQTKQKIRKGHGRRHKSDCLCAICVLKRRRREREENAQSQLRTSDNNLSQELKHEESSHVGSPSGENSSSDIDGALQRDADATLEESKEVKTGESEQQFDGPSGEKQEEEDEEEEEDDEEEEESEAEMKDEGNGDASQQLDKSREEPTGQLQPLASEKFDAGQKDTMTNTLAQYEEGTEAHNQEEEVQGRRKKAKVSENVQFENPILLDLCGILFPKNTKSIWSGPHSLVQRRTPRTNSLQAAINVLME